MTVKATNDIKAKLDQTTRLVSSLTPLLVEATANILNDDTTQVTMLWRQMADLGNAHVSLTLSIHEPSSKRIAELLHSFDAERDAHEAEA